jgi:3'-5' exoribonuclease
MPQKPALAALPLGTQVHEVLLVLDLEVKGGGSPYTIITLGNKQGRIPSAPFWASQTLAISGVKKGDPVQVVGEIGTYGDRRQLMVDSIRPVPRTQVSWRDLMPSVEPVEPWWRSIDRWRAAIDAPRLNGVVGLFYDDPGFRSRYQECPASVNGHHARLGGLLQHTCEVAAIGNEIAATCGADRELVLAGILLHDIGKLESYSWNGSFEQTTAGALLGHVVLGAMMLDHRVRQAAPPPCSDAETVLLQHLILSHHGRLDFGAPVPPMTLEAEVIHFADNASAKTASMSEALADSENFPGDSALSRRGIWQLDRRRAYRGASDWGRMT